MIELPGFDLKQETNQLVGDQYHSLEERYGKDSKNHKPYHNGEHALQVAKAAAVIALRRFKPRGFIDEKYARVPAGLINDIVIAGMFHDDVQEFGHGKDEALSAENALEAVRHFPYFTGKHKARIREAIMSTSIDLETFTQVPEGMLGEVLADADLHGLGSPTEVFMIQSHKLFREFHPGESLHGAAMHKFLGKSIDILASHRYFTPEAEELFPHRQENLLAVQALRRHLGHELGIA